MSIIYEKHFSDQNPLATEADQTRMFLKAISDYAELFQIDTVVEELSDCVQASFFLRSAADLTSMKMLFAMADDIACVANEDGKGITVTVEKDIGKQ